MGDEKKKSRWWIWLLVGLTVLCGLPVTMMAWWVYSFGEAGRPQPVDCAEAMDFARGRLPADAQDARCTGMHWQDSYVTVDFRMPRAGVADWLKATYPDAEPDTPCEEDLCRVVDHDQVLYVHVKVVYEDDGTGLVHLTSFDM